MRLALYMQATPWLDPSDMAEVFEVRIYSLGRKSFGTLLQSRRIRAAHCLTSVQFSPTSQHLLLAYGRCGFHGCSHAPPACIAWHVPKLAKLLMEASSRSPVDDALYIRPSVFSNSVSSNGCAGCCKVAHSFKICTPLLRPCIAPL